MFTICPTDKERGLLSLQLSPSYEITQLPKLDVDLGVVGSPDKLFFDVAAHNPVDPIPQTMNKTDEICGYLCSNGAIRILLPEAGIIPPGGQVEINGVVFLSLISTIQAK